MKKTVVSLNEVWSEFRQQNPKVRIRDAARILGVSEAALVAAAPADESIRLQDNFKALIKEAGSLQKVMALTRNDFCVHERKGIYEKITTGGHVGLVLGPDIDLRLFLNRWKYGFAVQEKTRRSLQFFDASGTAVHKIYLTPESDTAAYEELLDRYRTGEGDHSGDTPPPLDLSVKAASSARNRPAADEPVNAAAAESFRAAWLNMKDTHDFFGILRKYRLNREKAMHMAPRGYAMETSRRKLFGLMERISATELPVMVFTGSPACVQIHSGQLRRLVRTGPWFNVLDPDFNLHLNEEGIQSVWLVKKPTKDGIVTGIEVFDRRGELIMQLFGKRKPGIPEDVRWRDLVAGSV